jgi:hypothetical protein
MGQQGGNLYFLCYCIETEGFAMLAVACMDGCVLKKQWKSLTFARMHASIVQY